MKIKSILHAAGFIALALMAAIAVAAATHTPTDPQPTSGSLSENLNPITSLSFAAEEGLDLGKNTYYDGNKWYKYGGDRYVTNKGDDVTYNYDWKTSHAIVFKLAKGKYNITVNYTTAAADGGIWVYSGNSHIDTYNSEVGYSKQGAVSGYKDYIIENIEVNSPQLWWVSATFSGTTRLHSITVEKVGDVEEPEPEPLSPNFPSDIPAINDNTFWYHNGGEGIGYVGSYGSFYRYFVNKSGNFYAPTSTNMISINGKDFKSYELKKNEAVGFKLAPYNNGDEYRIRLYYYSEGVPAVLVSGTDALSATEPLSYETEIIIRDSGGEDTKTRMRTYHVGPTDNTVYWVKNNNTDGQSLYLGGFEILKKKEGNPTGEFTGSWYVEDDAVEIINSIDNNEKVVGSIAQSHDGVVTGIVTMPINNYEAITGHKSVMMNWGSKIGVNIPAGATLSFNYTADDANSGIAINKDGKIITLSNDADATSNYNKFANYKGEVSYTNNSGSTETIWIQGMSANYAYFSGFEVTLPDEPATPVISEDYVWYPVDRSSQFDLDDTSREYTVKVGFQTNSDGSLKTEKHKLYKKDHIFYRTAGNTGTRLSFKIQSGKKGVINVYYANGSTVGNFPLYENGTKVNTTSCNIDDAILVQYHFDTTGGAKEYYLQRTGDVWFGGFEVLFEEATAGASWLDKTLTYKVEGNETIKNALADDTYSAIKTGELPVAGPSMILRQPATDNTVMVFERDGVRNSILVRVNDESRYLNVKGYLDGATIRIYKGAPSSSNTEFAEVTGSGAIDKTVSIERLGGAIGDLYYITSDNTAGAYVTSVTPKDGNFTELQPTDVNYIYKVSGVPSSDNGGVQNSGDCNGRIMFVDQNSSAWTDGNSKMNVIGTEVTPVVIENGTDFFAVKVDEGPAGVKTGYVKVYFNGGSSAVHKMEELPLSDPMYSGWNSTYDPATHVITFDGGGGGRGWWFGNEGAGAKDLSLYNKINIEIGEVTGSPNLQVVVQCANGAYAAFPYDSTNKRILGDLTDQTKWYDSKDGEKFDIKKISQIYIQDNNVDNTTASVEIKSARLMNKPVVIATDNDADPANGYTEVFGGKIYDLPDGKVYEYPFDLSKKGTQIPQLIWITGAGTTGTTNIAAIEVLYDSNHAKVVEWYVNKDTKMIVGSDDPSFKMEFDGETLEYPTGYDEYVTFYMSSGRQANVSFIMPEAVREVYDWQMALAKQTYSVDDDGYVIENDSLKASYGSHTIESTVIHNPKGLNMNKGKTTYDRNKGQKKDMNGITGNLYGWYTNSYDFPSKDKDDNYWAGVKITATQKENGKTSTETVDGKLGEWNIYMRFVAYKAPVAAESSNKVTVTAGQSGKIYYTVDSSDPDNLGAMSADDIKHSSTENYSSGVDVSKMNCIFKAAQYITTPCYFYDDISKGKDSATGNVLKVVSSDLAIVNDDPSVVYVKNKATDDDELFNTQEGGYMLTIPTGDKMADVTPHEQKYNANPFMYLTLGGKNHPYWAGSGFNLCGTDWKASDDSGLKTYLDSYKYKFDVVSVKNIKPWNTGSNQNQNPYTECNGGIGGADTEDGGMFLQPISGTILRFEPEYDGVITVWLRQNGCLDNNTQELGTFSRRPVFVMDENGRVMRRSKIKPTAAHYMGINGVWAINSSMCEERSQVEHTWLHEVAKQVFEDHPLYAGRFGDDFPNRWEVDGLDHSGHILYGWWYKGFDLNATRSKITSASHVSRFEYMEPELLYRSDKIFNMEMNQLGLNNGFAKYGFELPNFQYVRYRIPVKAGKTYYIGGRGTKNGFSAIRFDALAPNTSHLGLDDLRYSDNPEVVENPDQSSADYLKVTSNWSNNGNHDYKGTYVSQYDLTGKTEKEVLDAYGKLDKITIYETPVAGEPTNESKIKSQVEVDGKLYGMDEYDLGNLVGKTVDVELNRTFRAYNWHPIILPFSLSETRVEQYFGEGTVILYLDPAAHTMNNQLDENTGKSWTSVVSQALEGTKLSFTIHRYQMLYANTPAFICPTFKWSNAKKSPATNNVKPTVSNGAVSGITFRRVTLDGSNSRNFLSDGCIGYAINNDYEVVGSYDQTVQSGDIYFVNNTNPNGGEGNVGAQLLHSSNKSVTMKGTRVWIRPRSGVANAAPILTVGSKGFSDFEEDSESAGISDIVADDYTIEGYDIEDDSVYDLLGRKVGQGSLDGLLKGVYIFHGKKVYVK